MYQFTNSKPPDFIDEVQSCFLDKFGGNALNTSQKLIYFADDVLICLLTGYFVEGSNKYCILPVFMDAVQRCFVDLGKHLCLVAMRRETFNLTAASLCYSCSKAQDIHSFGSTSQLEVVHHNC